MGLFDLSKAVNDRLGILSFSYSAKSKKKRGDSSGTSFSDDSNKPRKRIIDYDKEDNGVLHCPQVNSDEVVAFSTCKACPYHEGPSLRNFFMRSCLFDEEKHEVSNRPFPRWKKKRPPT